MTGKVKRWVADRGFGFVVTGEGDVFVHHSAIEDGASLEVGEQVDLEFEQTGRGLRATRVRRVADSTHKSTEPLTFDGGAFFDDDSKGWD